MSSRLCRDFNFSGVFSLNFLFSASSVHSISLVQQLYACKRFGVVALFASEIRKLLQLFDIAWKLLLLISRSALNAFVYRPILLLLNPESTSNNYFVSVFHSIDY